MSTPVIDPRYPIGKYQVQPFSEKQLKEWLHDIESLPKILEAAVQDLDENQYEMPYREGGWKIKLFQH